MTNEEKLESEQCKIADEIQAIREQMESNNKKISAKERMKQLIMSINKIDRVDDEPVYFSNDKAMFRIIKSGYLLVSHDNIWSIFSNEYDLNYQEVSELIADMVDETIKIKGLTPTWNQNVGQFRVDETLKIKGVTPLQHDEPEIGWVDETLKIKGVTQLQHDEPEIGWVDETLKIKGVTPLLVWAEGILVWAEGILVGTLKKIKKHENYQNGF